MKKLIMLVMILFANMMLAQEQSSINKNNREFKFGTYLLSGIILSPYGSPSFTLGFELKNSKLFGFGMDLNFGTYDSPNLNLNPPITEIQNYNPNNVTFSGIDAVSCIS